MAFSKAWKNTDTSPGQREGVLLNYSIWVPMENTAGAWISAVAHACSLNERSVPHAACPEKKNLISLSEIPSGVDGRCRRGYGVNKPGFDLNSSPVPKVGFGFSFRHRGCRPCEVTPAGLTLADTVIGWYPNSSVGSHMTGAAVRFSKLRAQRLGSC